MNFRAVAPNGKFLFQMMKVEIDDKLMKSIAKNRRAILSSNNKQ
jgi:Ca-activated chloride channel family protein